MAAAYDRGFFDDLVTPFLGLYRDNNLRADSSAEKLAKLKPVFGVKSGDATMTAGNSTPLTDGASVSLLSTEEWASAHGLPVLAYYVDAETAAVDYVNGKDGLLMAPTYAVPRLLARNGLSLQDFDFYEIHEAFASVVLAHLQAWESEEYCKERLGLDAALGSIDRIQAQRQRLVAGGRSPVRRDRRPDRRAAGQAARREEEGDGQAGTRTDLDLRRRWTGRRRHSRGLTSRFHRRVTPPTAAVDTRDSSVLSSDPPTRRQHGATTLAGPSPP